MAEQTERRYVLQVGYSDEEAWSMRLIAADGSLLVSDSGANAQDALVELAAFLEDEAERGFPTSRERL